jgi:hypothetical protein
MARDFLKTPYGYEDKVDLEKELNNPSVEVEADVFESKTPEKAMVDDVKRMHIEVDNFLSDPDTKKKLLRKHFNMIRVETGPNKMINLDMAASRIVGEVFKAKYMECLQKSNVR